MKTFLLRFLHSQEFFEKFREFLKDRFASENLIFRSHAQRFHSLFANPETRKAAMNLGKEIWESFLKENTDFELNLSADTFYRCRLKSINWEDLGEDFLDQAEGEVLNLLRVECFVDFIKTQNFKAFQELIVLSKEHLP